MLRAALTPPAIAIRTRPRPSPPARSSNPVNSAPGFFRCNLIHPKPGSLAEPGFFFVLWARHPCYVGSCWVGQTLLSGARQECLAHPPSGDPGDLAFFRL